MKVTCTTWAVVFLALCGASGAFVYRRAPFAMAAVIGGFVGGVLLTIVVSWLSAIPGRMREWWLVLRARLGSEPRDRKRTAIIGTLRGNGEVVTPFAKQRCLLYAYDVIATDGSGEDRTTRKAYEGFAMVPLSLEHGGARTRILGKPELPKIDEKEVKSKNAEWNAKRFIEDTTFTAPEPDVEANIEGRLRYDYSRPPIETNMGACKLVERTLIDGASVCAIGEYNGDRQALLAPVTLRVGRTFVSDAAWRVVNAGIGAVIFAAFALVAAAIFCVNFPIDMAESARPQWTLRWWEIDLERFVDRNVRAPLVRAEVVGSRGYSLREVCEGCAEGRLEIHGRTVELKHATYAGGRAVHLSARRGDRDGVTLDGKRVVLTWGGKSAAVPESWMQENDVETSLGSDGEYAGRITIVAPDRSIRCRVHFNTRVDDDAWLR